MAIRFTQVHGTTYLNEITVEIHDEDFSGDSTGLTFTDNGLIEKSEGEYLDVIKTTNYKCSIYLDSEETLTFFDDLIEADEGRFHLVVYRDTTLLFKGRIIVDSMTKTDELNPILEFHAIDGLTLLKSVKYVGPYGNLRERIVAILNQNDVVNKMYSSSDNLLVMASNLQFDDPYYDGVSFYEHTWNSDYFFKLDKNREERLTAWEVLIESLNRYGLNLRYWKGVYYCFSAEFPGEAWNAANGYKKDGTGVAILVPGTTVNINTLALKGAKWKYENGLKTVQINAKKEFANAFFGENMIWEKLNTSYQSIGSLVHDEVYSGLVTIDVTQLLFGATGPYPPFFSVKMWIKETNFATSAVTYLRSYTQQVKHNTFQTYNMENFGSTEDYTELAYILQTGKAELKVKLPAVTYDRGIEIKFQFYQYLKYDYTAISGSPNVTTLDYNYKIKIGTEPLSEAKDLYFRATVTGDNVRELIINNLGCDYNGNDLVKTFFFDGGGSSDINKSTDRWRYSNSESWGPLEPAIVRKMLEYNEANIEKILIPCNFPLVTSESIGLPTIYLTKFVYKSITYFTYGIEIDHFKDIVRIYGFKVNAKSSKTITAFNVRSNETNPEGKETVGDTSNFGSYNEYQKGKTEVHVMDVVGDDLQLDYAIPTGSSFRSIRQSIKIFVEGVRWKQVETLVTNNANRATYTLGDDGLATFHPAIPNKTVIADIVNYFETGIST